MTECFQCGYEIGTAAAARCPECGIGVEVSQPHAALASEPVRLQLVSAVTLMRIVMFVGVLLYLPALVAELVIGDGVISSLFAAGGVAAAVVYAIAVWNLTDSRKREFILHPDHWPVHARLIARIGSIGAAGSGMFTLALSGYGGDDALVVQAIGLLFAVAAVIMTTVGVYGCLAAIARMIPDRALYRRALLLRWVMPMLLTIGAVLLVGPLIAGVLEFIFLGRLREKLGGHPSD